MSRIKVQKDYDGWYQAQGKGYLLTESLVKADTSSFASSELAKVDHVSPLSFPCEILMEKSRGRVRYKCLVCEEKPPKLPPLHPQDHPFLRLKHSSYSKSNYVTHNQSTLTHHNVFCLECCRPAVGILYQCTFCPNVRLCEVCELLKGHANFSHPLLKIFHSQSS
ncbi:hypothetical protein AC1031_017644 [Aphanomyces cochlioides]|nr:hypothetical protein AC1031_017644 [Aphanomyces cochlioides]